MKKLLFILLTISFSFSAQAQTAIEGDITTSTTLTASNTYLLKGFVRVKSGAVLTIEPGTVIYGDNLSQGSLIVLPGGRIIADGTKDKPIVFTSMFDKPGSSQTPQRGDWGGVIILGKAPINVPGGTASIEGPGDSYGGNDPEDNSGILRYVRIQYAGIAFSPNNEINGLTFGGVGRGTIVDFVQVAYANDDSFEWFGGTVNCKHLISYKGLDDDFDTDFGYQGKLQFLLAIRDPQVADVSGSNGFESDNDGSGSTNNPRTSPTWWNVTLIGPKASSSTQINSNYKRAMHLRRSSLNKVNNAIITGWPTGILIDGSKTIASAISGEMYIDNSIISGCAKPLDTVKTNGSFDVTNWFTATHKGRIINDNSELFLADPFNASAANPMPLHTSPALTGGATPPSDGFFDVSATYVGAFGLETGNWTSGWSTLTITEPTDVNEEKVASLPAEFGLKQNYPNPFNPATTLDYTLENPGMVRISVYNVTGQEVANLVEGYRAAGSYRVTFDARNLTSGIYLCRMEAGSKIFTRKMTLLK